jgi:hypothetical protein
MRPQALAALLPSVILLGACASIPDLKPVASYGQSNALSPAGYWENKIDDTHYQVTATGTDATPKDRVEKIARARAAQIAVENKMKYYKVASVQHGLSCKKGHDFYKGGSTQASARPTVLVDVVYAKDTADPTFVSAAESYETLSGDLANEVVPADAKVAAEQETRAACGQGA